MQGQWFHLGKRVVMNAMSGEEKQAEIDLLKEMVEELRILRKRVEDLEGENNTLKKAVDDPETMMKKAGWLKVVTPMADETYDPLQRDSEDDFGFSGPFTGSGGMITKQSRHDELEEWKEAERNVNKI